MYMTGFADEASASIEGQIAVTKALGWRNIESRNINGINIHDMPDKDFDAVVGKLADAGVKINCFGSAIANWAKSVSDPFDITATEIKRAIPRMKRLDSKLIRIMSYKVIPDTDDQMEEERFKRVREIVKMFMDEGITPVHENCMNYGGMSWRHTLKLVENVPSLKLVYDTGNPIFSVDRSKPDPKPMQSSWEFYSHIKRHIAYIHIKDGKFDKASNKSIFMYPGEGDGDVLKIADDLVKTGYDGGISIEPHMAMVHHDPNDPKKSAKESEDIYVEYGRRMMRILTDRGAKIK